MIKTKIIKIGLAGATILSLLGGAGVALAAAGDLTWSAAQTIDLSSPDLNLTIASGSTAESLVVNTGTVVANLASGDVFTVALEAAGNFGVSPTTGVIITCPSTTIATVTITATGTQAYTITPSATACSYVAPGGGGGGGGGGGYPPPAPAPAPATPAQPATPATPASKEVPGCGTRTTGYSSSTGESCAGNTATTPATPATPATPSANASASARTSFNFGTTTLKNGSRGEAVKELQRFLNQVLNLGLVVDGALGPKTIAVIKQWQSDNGLVPDGLIGPKTKTMMNTEVAGTATATTPSVEVTTSSSGSYNFGTTTLKNGSRGEAVKELQRFLNATLNLGLVVDGAFGPNTTSVMKKWQTDHGLVADGLVGLATKAQMNASVGQ